MANKNFSDKEKRVINLVESLGYIVCKMVNDERFEIYGMDGELMIDKLSISQLSDLYWLIKDREGVKEIRGVLM